VGRVTVENLSEHCARSADNSSRRWAHSIGLSAAIGIAYYLAGRLGVGLILKPEGVAVFWPAAGISSGVLIALGRRERWAVATGVVGATVVVHLVIADPVWAGFALGASNAAEALADENFADKTGPIKTNR
jgi:integral membrane sensor domain MASE1